jgi:hypothetical protein
MLVASLQLIPNNAIADMDDVRYVAHMATLIAMQSFRACQLAANLQGPGPGIEHVVDLPDNKYFSVLRF